jgi:hypothetical protein
LKSNPFRQKPLGQTRELRMNRVQSSEVQWFMVNRLKGWRIEGEG